MQRENAQVAQRYVNRSILVAAQSPLLTRQSRDLLLLWLIFQRRQRRAMPIKAQILSRTFDFNDILEHDFVVNLRFRK